MPASGSRLVPARASQTRFALRPGAVEVILVRHGAAERGTALHARFLQCDPPLAVLGERQVDQVASRLARTAISAVFASPLGRAVATAEAVAVRHRLDVVHDDDLREVALGAWELDFEDRLATRDERALRVVREGRWNLAPGGEPPDGFSSRVRRAINRVVRHSSPGTRVVAVAHAGVIAEACRIATGTSGRVFAGNENASISRLLVTASGNWRLLSFNETGHLD